MQIFIFVFVLRSLFVQLLSLFNLPGPFLSLSYLSFMGRCSRWRGLRAQRSAVFSQWHSGMKARPVTETFYGGPHLTLATNARRRTHTNTHTDTHTHTYIHRQTRAHTHTHTTYIHRQTRTHTHSPTNTQSYFLEMSQGVSRQSLFVRLPCLCTERHTHTQTHANTCRISFRLRQCTKAIFRRHTHTHTHTRTHTHTHTHRSCCE